MCCRLAVKSHVLLQGLLFPRTIAISNERHAATFNRNACSLDPVNKVKPVWPARPRRELRHDGTIIVGKELLEKEHPTGVILIDNFRVVRFIEHVQL